jgi:hypothetical protein
VTTNSGASPDFRLTVLNPKGRDQAQGFSLGINAPEAGEHPPVNFHGYAACTSGNFEREVSRAIALGQPVLLLLRGDFKATLRALYQLKRHRLPVVVSFKETGLHQIARQLRDPNRTERFRKIVQEADGYLAATPDALVFCDAGRFIPTPYPLDDARWDFSRSLDERRGVFVGTREWETPSRHHLAALVMAAELGEPITVFDEDARRCRRLLSKMAVPTHSLRILQKRLPYRDYLSEMARHKIVLQADRSSVPGQVAGDALLCRLVCVGGDGAIERLAFPATSGHGRSLGELKELATRLLCQPKFYEEIIAQSQQLAQELVSYETVARQLAQFFSALPSK